MAGSAKAAFVVNTKMALGGDVAKVIARTGTYAQISILAMFVLPTKTSARAGIAVFRLRRAESHHRRRCRRRPSARTTQPALVRGIANGLHSISAVLGFVCPGRRRRCRNHTLTLHRGPARPARRRRRRRRPYAISITTATTTTSFAPDQTGSPASASTYTRPTVTRRTVTRRTLTTHTLTRRHATAIIRAQIQRNQIA